MPNNELSITDSESVERLASPRSVAGEDNLLAIDVNTNEVEQAGWDNIVDHRLIEWALARSEFEVDGLLGPSHRSIAVAFKLVQYMRTSDWPLPTDLIPDGEGGIVFENRRDPLYQRIEIDEFGNACLATFQNCQLTERVPIDIE